MQVFGFLYIDVHIRYLWQYLLYISHPVVKGWGCSGGSRISHGGHRPRRGGIDSRGSYVSKILYVDMKESGPLGGDVR